jgi:hypothetical protein
MLKRLKFVDRVIHTSMGGGVLAQVHMHLTKIHKKEFKMSKSSKKNRMYIWTLYSQTNLGEKIYVACVEKTK